MLVQKLKSLFYNVKWFIRNIWRYRKGLYYEVRPWDSHGTMWLFKESIRDIRDSMQDESGVQEIDETRIPKEMDINRAIRLIENYQDHNYAKRCGYNYDYDTKFVSKVGNPELFELVTTETPEIAKHNEGVILKASRLQEAEHKELIELISKYREWWI